MTAGVAVVFADHDTTTAVGAGVFSLPNWRDLDAKAEKPTIETSVGIVKELHAGLLDTQAVPGGEQCGQGVLQCAHAATELQVGFRAPGELAGQISFSDFTEDNLAPNALSCLERAGIELIHKAGRQ